MDNYLLEKDISEDAKEAFSTVLGVQRALRKLTNHLCEVLDQLKEKAPYRVSQDMNLTRSKLANLIEES